MRIPEFGGSGPVWVREIKLMSLATALNSAIVLHNLERTLPFCAFTAQYVSKLRNLLSPGDGKGTRLDFIDAYAEFRRNAAEITQPLGDSVFRPYRPSNKLPLVGTTAVELLETSTLSEPESAPNLAAAAAAASSGNQSETIKHESPNVVVSHPNLGTNMIVTEHGVQPREGTLNISKEAYEYTGQYVAFQYSVYIGYVLHQLQNLLLCSIVCFVLVVGALSSFSFQAPGVMFHVLLTTLAVSAVAVLIVLAQMERDPILSRLSGPPKANSERTSTSGRWPTALSRCSPSQARSFLRLVASFRLGQSPPPPDCDEVTRPRIRTLSRSRRGHVEV